MKMIRFVLLLVISASLWACSEVEPGDWTHTNHITQCANPWATPADNTDDALAEAVKTFLADNGITVLDIRVRDAETDLAICQACPCAGTKIIDIRISEADSQTLEDLDLEDYQKWDVILSID